MYSLSFVFEINKILHSKLKIKAIHNVRTFSDCICDYITVPLKLGDIPDNVMQLHGQLFVLDTKSYSQI